MKTSRQLKLSLVFFFLSCLLGVTNAKAQNSNMSKHLVIQGGTYDITATTSRGSSSISGMGSYSASIGIELFPHFVAFGSIAMLVSDGISGDTATGYDLGVKYYFATTSGRNIYADNEVKFNLITNLRPYVGASLSQRQFTEVLSSSYIGPSAMIGADYQIYGNWYLNFEFKYSNLTGNADNELQQTNILFGLGLQL